MFVPALLGVGGRAADFDHVGGALITTMAVLVMGAPLRLVRYLNVALGLGVATAPCIVVGAGGLGALAAAAVGLSSDQFCSSS